MPQQDKETLSSTDIPSLAPTKDEVAQRQRVNGSKSVSRDKAQVAPKASTSTWILSIFIVILIAALVGLARWNYFLQRQVDSTGQLAEQSQERIGDLELRLSTSDDSINKSGVVMQVQIKELKDKTDGLWEQMDKLWASAWRRNQKELVDHSQQLKALQEKQDKQVQSLKVLEDKLKNSISALTDIDTRLQALNKVPEQYSQIKKDFEQQRELLRQVNDALNRINAERSVLDKRVKTNEEWVESINGYRKQTNITIEQMQQRINTLQSAGSP